VVAHQVRFAKPEGDKAQSVFLQLLKKTCHSKTNLSQKAAFAHPVRRYS
jgi:hypothetical protein